MLRNLLFKIEDLLGLSPQYSSNTAFIFGREFPRQAIIAIPALALLGVLTYFAFSDTSASAQPAPPMVVATLPAESTKATTALGATGVTTPVNALPSATATVAGSTTPATSGTPSAATPAGAQAPASTGGATTPTPRPTTAAAAPTQPPSAPTTAPAVAPVFEPTQAPVAPVVPTNTPLPLDTATPIPTNTLVPTPTRTATPEPTATPKVNPKLTLDPSSYTIGGSATFRASISGYPANQPLTIQSAITAQSFPKSVLDLTGTSDVLPLTVDGQEGSPQAKTNAQGGGDEINEKISISKSDVCAVVDGIEDSADLTADQKEAIIDGLWGQSITVKVTVFAGGKSASDTFKLSTPSNNPC